MLCEWHDFRIVLQVDKSRTALCYGNLFQFFGIGRLFAGMLRYYGVVVGL